MHCFCEEDEEMKYLKVEGDFGADPIWCDDCGSNLDIGEIPLSQPLKIKLMKWARQYGEWMDWEQDQLQENAVSMEEEHNRLGQLLTEEVQKEFNTQYKVFFTPSASEKMYNNQNK